MWEALRNDFEQDTLVNKLMLTTLYFRKEAKESISIEAHIKAMKELTDCTTKATVSEEVQVVNLFGSLPSSYLTVVTALEARDAVRPELHPTGTHSEGTGNDCGGQQIRCWTTNTVGRNNRKASAFSKGRATEPVWRGWTCIVLRIIKRGH